jgi:hypothetical protein
MAIIYDELDVAILDETGSAVEDEFPIIPPAITPLTIWRPQTTDGTGELIASTSANIDTESGLDITTESGITLIIEPLVYVLVPLTNWTENDSI